MSKIGFHLHIRIIRERAPNFDAISVEPFHLFRYLDERMFTFNMRELDDYGRFETVLRAVTGRRLTYAQLTGHST